MRGPKIDPYHAIGSYPLPLGFNGRWAPVYRWFSGRPLNGHRYTDATGFRYGTTALDVSGHATTYQFLPGALRFLYVRLPIMAAVPFVLAWLVWPLAMYLVTLGLVLVATWRVQRWRVHRAFRRDVIEPVAAGVSTVLATKRVAGQGHTWVDIPEDFRDDPEAKITVSLPLGWVARDGDRANLVSAVATKINMDELTATWTLSGSTPSVTLAKPAAPPEVATFASALADAEATPDNAPMVGYGARGKIENFSLALESPHLLINGGSGAGKSVFIAWLVAQFMRRGYGVLVLDAKFVSHMWLRRIPGVLYASEAEDLHNALVWLDAELLRRARVVSSAADTDAASAALVPLVAVLEEINGATNRLRSYWKSIKGPEDPALSPALTALANLANMGREMRVHVLLAGQSITAKSTGGPEGRESFGGRALARATANAWRMLAPQIKPAPLKRGRPGRWHLVVGDTLREFQVPFVDLKNEAAPDSVAQLIEWATGGRPVPDVAAMLASWEGVGGDDDVQFPSSEPPTPAGVSLRLYADQAGLDLKTLTRWRERRSDFPVEVGLGANGAKLYDQDHLRAYVRERGRELREDATLD
jgi:hypothetical protein